MATAAPPKYAKNQVQLAGALGITRQTIAEMTKVADFPKKGKMGWSVAKVDDWCKENQRGPYGRHKGNTVAGKKGRQPQSGEDGVTLTQANIKRTLEQAENERIKKERQLVEQAKELNNILSREDVTHICSQMIATVRACADTLKTGLDRAMPEKYPSEEVYQETRTKVLELAGRLERDLADAMDELWQ